MKYLSIAMLGFFVMLVPSVHAAGSSDSSFIGRPISAGYGVQVKEWRTSPEALETIKDMGAEYLRFGFEWRVIEKNKGVYDWSAADLFMKQIHDKGLHAVYEVGGLNALYSPVVATLPNKPLDQGQQMPAAPISPEALTAMEKFIAETVRRYHGENILWEIWNEPDMNSNWPPEVSATDFAKIISITCATIKKVDPHATVIGPALAYLPSRNENGHGDFLATILKSTAGTCLDAISIHPYRHHGQPPETAFKDYNDIRAYIARNTLSGHKKLPVVSSEWGYSLTETTPEQQAAYALRSLIVNNLAGIPVSIWYEWRDSLEDEPTSGTENREAHFGLRNYDDSEKLSFKVMNEIVPYLRGMRVEKRVAVGNDEIYVLFLRNEKSQQHALLFWMADRTIENPKVLHVEDKKGTANYPIGIIPTLVCTGSMPPIISAVVSDQVQQRYYIPCSD